MKTTESISFVKRISNMMKKFGECYDVIGKYTNQSLYVDRFFFF